MNEQLIELERLTREAGRVALEARKSLVRELKRDTSIVTNADRAVETYLREALPAFIPGAGFWGEEFGYEAPTEAGQWLVDPVDGTSNFAFGSPLWGVSIGLAVGGVIELGAIFLPDLNEMYVAGRGQGAFMNGTQMNPIPAGPVKDEELVSYCDHVVRRNPGARFPGKMRCSGAFVIDGTFTATQRFRGLIGIRERLYDVAASVLLGQELGAEVRYVDGSPFDIPALQSHVHIERPWIIFPRDSGFTL